MTTLFIIAVALAVLALTLAIALMVAADKLKNLQSMYSSHEARIKSAKGWGMEWQFDDLGNPHPWLRDQRRVDMMLELMEVWRQNTADRNSNNSLMFWMSSDENIAAFCSIVNGIAGVSGDHIGLRLADPRQPLTLQGFTREKGPGDERFYRSFDMTAKEGVGIIQ
jgi:hypothetical protein